MDRYSNAAGATRSDHDCGKLARMCSRFARFRDASAYASLLPTEGEPRLSPPYSVIPAQRALAGRRVPRAGGPREKPVGESYSQPSNAEHAAARSR
ncbi:MAG: hypothetical protein ACREV1_00155 [Gammaproteobacteria bacterium]